MSQQLDKKIIDKIKELVNEGVRDPKEMRRALEGYVRKEFFCRRTISASNQSTILSIKVRHQQSYIFGGDETTLFEDRSRKYFIEAVRLGKRKSCGSLLFPTIWR